jgi:spore coat polysaccharide biosynthesis protein SpsF
VDEEEDFQLMGKILEELYPSNPEFTMEDVLDLLNSHPEWVKLNAGIEQKKI